MRTDLLVLQGVLLAGYSGEAPFGGRLQYKIKIIRPVYS